MLIAQAVVVGLYLPQQAGNTIVYTVPTVGEGAKRVTGAVDFSKEETGYAVAVIVGSDIATVEGVLAGWNRVEATAGLGTAYRGGCAGSRTIHTVAMGAAPGSESIIAAESDAGIVDGAGCLIVENGANGNSVANNCVCRNIAESQYDGFIALHRRVTGNRYTERTAGGTTADGERAAAWSVIVVRRGGASIAGGVVHRHVPVGQDIETDSESQAAFILNRDGVGNTDVRR